MEISRAPAQLTTFSHRYETGSQPMVLYDSRGNLFAVKFAEKVEYGTTGLAREYIAGGAAELIDAPAPTTTFVQLTAAALTMDPRIAFADGTRPAPQVTVGSAFVTNASSPATPGAFTTVPVEDVAAVFVFNAWVSVGDRHWGNYIIQTTSFGPRLISVDYATCLSRGSTPTSIGDPDLISLLRSARQPVATYLARLRGVPERSLRELIARVPGSWLASSERERIARFLIDGREETARLVTAAIA